MLIDTEQRMQGIFTSCDCVSRTLCRLLNNMDLSDLYSLGDHSTKCRFYQVPQNGTWQSAHAQTAKNYFLVY